MRLSRVFVYGRHRYLGSTDSIVNSKERANIEELEPFPLTTTDLAVSHWLHDFCTLLWWRALMKNFQLSHFLMNHPFVNVQFVQCNHFKPATSGFPDHTTQTLKPQRDPRRPDLGGQDAQTLTQSTYNFPKPTDPAGPLSFIHTPPR